MSITIETTETDRAPGTALVTPYRTSFKVWKRTNTHFICPLKKKQKKTPTGHLNLNYHKYFQNDFNMVCALIYKLLIGHLHFPVSYVWIIFSLNYHLQTPDKPTLTHFKLSPLLELLSEVTRCMFGEVWSQAWIFPYSAKNKNKTQIARLQQQPQLSERDFFPPQDN